jgi:spore coat polysaccharide biosynthesis protein SpsF
MKTLALIQARMASSRLPGKVLMKLGSGSVLARVVRRVQRARLVDEVVVATTIDSSDDSIVEECELEKVRVARGSEDDVLDRYYQAARELMASTVVRITADCPLIDPTLIDDVVLEFQRQLPDYASNTLVRTYPRGLDTEVFSIDALARAWQDARQPWERAHVTPFLYQHPEMFRLVSVCSDHDHSGCRWTLDTPEDYEFLREVYLCFEDRTDFSWRDVLDLLQREPRLSLINANSSQKDLHEG